MMTDSHPETPTNPEPQVEADARFPSGPWCGFFLMSHLPGRHQMELHLTFRQGVMTGEGRDMIGPFLIRGRYQVDDGQCWWTKRYHRQARRFLPRLQRRQGDLGAVGDPPELARRIPHLARVDGRPDPAEADRGHRRADDRGRGSRSRWREVVER